MTRILMRSPHSPFVPSNHKRAIAHDEINANSGNLLFPYSISRALMTPGVEIDYVKSSPKPARPGMAAGQADERYDCFVIPLANAFRGSFAYRLEQMTEFIESVDMPCIVVGVGFQAGVSAKSKNKPRPVDDVVKRFVKAVLDKSACIGVRGQATGDYLKRLGFVPEEHYTVIGCPSMYLYGASLPKPRPLELTKQSRISLNCKVSLPEKAHRYLEQTARLVPDFHYVVQNTYEMKALYYGLDVRKTYPHKAALHISDEYPTGRKHPLVRAGRVVGFVDVPSWLNYLEGKDLSLGTRIHGNIAGVLSGAPTFILAPDSRVLELAEYHNIAHVTLKKLDESKDVFHLLDGVDFESVLDGHAERFGHYLDFLHRNGLKTVFDENPDGMRAVPFDAKVAEVAPSGPIAMQPLPLVLGSSLKAKADRRLEKAKGALLRSRALKGK